MRGPTIARLVMVGLFVTVLVAVAMQWRSPEDETSEATPTPPVVEEGVVARTDGARLTQIANGVLRYQVFAGTTVEYEGNRTTYEDGVELVLYSLPDDEGFVTETRVTAERLEAVRRAVPIDGDEFESIRLLDDVVAILPNGEELRSQELTFTDDELWTDSGARLSEGDIVLESKYLTYNADTGVARMLTSHEDTLRPDLRGPVRLFGSAGSGGDGFDIEGSANVLVYDLIAAELTLQEAPELRLPQAEITGREITLILDEVSNDIRAIESRVDARAVWLGATGEGDYVASGEVLSVDLGDGSPAGFRVSNLSEELARPRFELGEAGTMRGESIAVAFGEDGDDASVVSRGQAFFFPDDAGEGLDSIGADTLTIGTGAVQQLDAVGNARVELDSEGTEKISLAGPRARFVLGDQELSSAVWPAGLTFEDPESGLRASAGRGEYDPETTDWVLSPADDDSGRPGFQSADFDVTAEVIRLLQSGGTELEGAVDARLRGDMIRTVGPLFGGAPEIQAAAEHLRVAPSSQRMEFTGASRIFQSSGDQLLAADEISITPVVNELQASGNVYVSLVDPPDPAAGRDEERVVVLTGQQLLVEGSPDRRGQEGAAVAVSVAGEALLELQGRGRNIAGNLLIVALDDLGAWQSLDVYNSVVMTDAAGTGRGGRLEYDASTGLVVIYAAENAQATFSNDRGYDIRDPQGLRMEFEDDSVSVTAMQNGTTQLVQSGGRERPRQR